MSCGAIVLYCLNLPIEVRLLLENIFIVGIIPGPNSPDVWTISHILISFVESINAFLPPGRILPTYRYPAGVSVLVRILPLMADLGAIRKVAGYLSHNAHAFCTFCLLRSVDINDLDYASWILRDGNTVSTQAQEWNTAVTVKVKDELAKNNGVRWTPMHNLPQWDPVQHVVLGFMHNWLEGVVQHHLRMLWGIGRTKKLVTEMADLDKDEHFSASDISESESELEELARELQQARSHQQSVERNNDSMDVDEEESAASTTPTPSNFLSMDHDDDNDDDDDYLPTNFETAFKFSPDQLQAIRTCIREVELPIWVARPPTNLGEAKHGKLKAQEYLTLFTVILPLVIPEIWWGNDDQTETRLLQNFHSLVACTNIVSSFSTSNAEADQFMSNYVQYRRGLTHLFPEFPIMPNHHFAMHNGQLLKFWGPLASISEFPGERMNGQLGRVKHNRRVGK